MITVTRTDSLERGYDASTTSPSSRESRVHCLPNDFWFATVARRHPARPRRCAAGFALASTLILLALPSCQAPAPPASDTILTGEIRTAPMVRVRIVPTTPRVNLFSQRDIVVTPGTKAFPRRILRPPVTVQPMKTGIVVTGADRRGQRWSGRSVRLAALDKAPIRCRGIAYAGVMVAHHRDQPARPVLDVVNHLSIEAYLPGVLDRELYRNWHPNTFRAQAIAARSYAMHTMHRHRGRHYDVEASTADQAYGGITSNRNANDAVATTHGQVLTYQDHVLPAYYSSCCGGVGQDAASAFPTGLDILPLRGRRHGGWCRQSPYFRWGPLTRNKLLFERRLRAWGKARQHPLRTLSGIASIRVTQRNEVGRATGVVIHDETGQAFSLRAESMRLAANHEPNGLPPIDRKQRLPSAQMQATVTRDTIRFHDGRGFGHGVGMCQYGSQAQALAGHEPNAILHFYYPGATIDRLY